LKRPCCSAKHVAPLAQGLPFAVHGFICQKDITITSAVTLEMILMMVYDLRDNLLFGLYPSSFY
jgi:hypothetical protein